MPPSSFNKKLKPAKRAWKSISNMLKSRFRDLQISASIRESTSHIVDFLSRRLIVPFRTRYLRNSSFRAHGYRNKINNRSSQILEFLSRRLVVPFKTRYLKNPDFSRHRHKYSYIGQNEYQQIDLYQSRRRSDFSAVYVDKFYGEGGRGRDFEGEEGGRRRKEGIADQKEEKEEDEGSVDDVDTIEEAWRAVVAASPHLRVDERAEEFICKFREEIRIEKERPFLEFQERLQRSA